MNQGPMSNGGPMNFVFAVPPRYQPDMSGPGYGAVNLIVEGDGESTPRGRTALAPVCSIIRCDAADFCLSRRLRLQQSQQSQQ